MFAQRLREIWIALLLACATVAPASADGPRAGFKLDQKATVFISPDKKLRVEQYSKDVKDWRGLKDWRGPLYQFWTFDSGRRHAFLLNPGEDDDVAGYAAGFRFSPDSQWLVRMQKLGSGSQTLFLYRRNGYQFSPATKNPLVIWPGIISSPRRLQRGCIGTPRTRMGSITHLSRWSRGWKKTTPGWGSIGPTAAMS